MSEVYEAGKNKLDHEIETLNDDVENNWTRAERNHFFRNRIGWIHNQTRQFVNIVHDRRMHEYPQVFARIGINGDGGRPPTPLILFFPIFSHLISNNETKADSEKDKISAFNTVYPDGHLTKCWHLTPNMKDAKIYQDNVMWKKVV